MKKVAVVMGSDSDLDTMRPCIERLRSFRIPFSVRIISAHRTPAEAEAHVVDCLGRTVDTMQIVGGETVHLPVPVGGMAAIAPCAAF